MNRNALIYTLGAISLMLFMTSCQKNNNETVNASTFVKIYESETELIGRGALELPNGDLILLGCSYEIPAQSSVFGKNRSEIACFTSDGSLKWSKKVPKEVHALWDGKVLPNGNIVLAGFDSLQNSPNLGFVIIDGEGTVLNTKVLFNQIGWVPNPTSASFSDNNILSITALSNGMIVANVGIIGINTAIYLRLISLNQDLQLVGDRSFPLTNNPGDVIIALVYPSRSVEMENGNILIIANRNTGLINDTVKFRFLEMSIPHFDIVEAHIYPLQSKNTTYNAFIHNPHGFFVSQSYGDKSWPQDLRNMEAYFSNERISVMRLENDVEDYQYFLGLPGQGYFGKLEHTDDGGFVGIGNANLIESFTASQSQIVLGKFSPTGELQWTETINAGMPLFAHSIVQNARGYVISASTLSMDNKFQMVLIQVNNTGTL